MSRVITFMSQTHTIKSQDTFKLEIDGKTQFKVRCIGAESLRLEECSQLGASLLASEAARNHPQLELCPCGTSCNSYYCKTCRYLGDVFVFALRSCAR